MVKTNRIIARQYCHCYLGSIVIVILSLVIAMIAGLQGLTQHKYTTTPDLDS